MSEETITIKRDHLWKGAAGVFALLFVVALLTGGFNFGRTGAAVADTGVNNPTAPTGSVKVQIEANDPILGDPDAEVSIVEFSDFQCPYCGKAHADALAQFRQSNYFQDGQVNLIYKQFPLNSIHPYAQKAGEASLCAQDQDAFWEYHDTLFANQQALDTASLKAYAQQLGLNTGEFNSCLDSGEKASEVNKETAQAQAVGGRGTPYFVVTQNDGKGVGTISGACPYSTFDGALTATKAGKQWSVTNCQLTVF